MFLKRSLLVIIAIAAFHAFDTGVHSQNINDELIPPEPQPEILPKAQIKENPEEQISIQTNENVSEQTKSESVEDSAQPHSDENVRDQDQDQTNNIVEVTDKQAEEQAKAEDQNEYRDEQGQEQEQGDEHGEEQIDEQGEEQTDEQGEQKADEEDGEEQADEEQGEDTDEQGEHTDEHVEEQTDEQGEEKKEDEQLIPVEVIPELTEEDRVQNCLAAAIDCRFVQPVTLFDIEAALSSGKSVNKICKTLLSGQKCIQELLEGQCSEYILEYDKIQSAREAPVINYLCEEKIKEFEDNWECFKSGLTEANLNACSKFNDRSSCEITAFLDCLVEEFGDSCTEDAELVFRHLFSELALLKRADCSSQ